MELGKCGVPKAGEEHMHVSGRGEMGTPLLKCFGGGIVTKKTGYGG